MFREYNDSSRGASKVVGPGCRVLLNMKTRSGDERAVEYDIVNPGQTDLETEPARLSCTCPRVRPLIGHAEGERVVVKLPSKDIHFEIVRIEIPVSP